MDGKPKHEDEFFVPDLSSARPLLLVLLLAELLVLVHVLLRSPLPQFDWYLLGLCSLYVQWIALLSIAALSLLRPWLRSLPLFPASTACLVTVLAVTLASSLAAAWFAPNLTGNVTPGWWLLRNLLAALALSGIVLRYFFLRHQLQMRERHAVQARLDALQAKMKPHFLFNALNTIASLIETAPERAERAVEDLARLLRNSLQDDEQFVPLAAELRLCEQYLALERLRLGDRLQVKWHIEPELEHEPIPRLILQPLIENSIYHGIARLADGGEIDVAIRRENNRLSARISNPVPTSGGDTGGHRIALRNIEQRLFGLYGAQAFLRTEPGEGRFAVELGWPSGGVPA